MSDVTGEGIAEGDAQPIFRHWGYLGVGVATVLLLSIILTSYITSRTAQDVVGASGFVLTIWGLFISVAGFGVTWWQLKKTRDAASAVQRAMAKLKRDFGSFDVITELRTAKAAAEETQAHIEARRWSEAYAAYNRTRASLTKMLSVRGGLDSENLDIARDFVTTCMDGGQSVQKLNEDENAEVSKELLTSRLQELDGFLISIEYSMKDAMNGRE